jgi:hypothetical protein
MLSLYVDGDGYCFVSIPTLADDTELSQQTVATGWPGSRKSARSRGCRNGSTNMAVATATGRGKRTSDLIRLLIDVDRTKSRRARRAAKPTRFT